MFDSHIPSHVQRIIGPKSLDTVARTAGAVRPLRLALLRHDSDSNPGTKYCTSASVGHNIFIVADMPLAKPYPGRGHLGWKEA